MPKNIDLPGIVHPTTTALKLFGLQDLDYTFNPRTHIYTFQEKSGLIRSGFTSIFYINYKEYFTIVI